MGLDYRPQTTAAQFAQIFERERVQEYPVVDAFEQQHGVAVGRPRLEAAARVLCCPFKAAPPNWQHGRVIYSAVRRRLEALHLRMLAGEATPATALHVDIGTAKGFSALCAQWAMDDAGVVGQVHSVDVLPQQQRVRRNTVAEVDRLQTLAEVIAPFPDAARCYFHEGTGVDFLRRITDRIHTAFIDGKHATDAVSAEWHELAQRQEPGDLAIFDDVQMPPVHLGLKGAHHSYRFHRVELGTVNRAYAIGVRL
jgi:predicted O-methyltransferase YrrM